MSAIAAAAICLIACHGGGPADHFATFAKQLAIEGIPVKIFAAGQALKKFQDLKIAVDMPFILENLESDEEERLAVEIAKGCSMSFAVLTDVGHAFDIKLQQALARHAQHVPRFAYYDNPQDYVPGGYSAIASEVMLAAQGIIFSNANLANAPIYQEPNHEVNLDRQLRVGIGYYPGVLKAQEIAERRNSESLLLRSQLLSKHGLVDQGQRIVVYFGGNNEEYFNKAFPAFLSVLTDTQLKELIILIQQHPGAIAKNLDGQQAMERLKGQNSPCLLISDLSSDEAQILADAALYYQTSMAAQFVFEGIPTAQVGHEKYPDVLTTNGFPALTDSASLKQFLIEPTQEIPLEPIYRDLGIREDWFSELRKALKV
jgi:hypothetical protein